MCYSIGTRTTRIGRICTGFISEYPLNQRHQRSILMEHGTHGLGGFARIFICDYPLNQCHQRAILLEHGAHGLGGFARVLSASIS